jgi:hypothetical protein
MKNIGIYRWEDVYGMKEFEISNYGIGKTCQ